MRIIAGQWRGTSLASPPGLTTRPTAQRMRQSLFDTLMHAPWGGRALLDGALVLDAFAGTGALGLEALSRGAARAVFIDNDDHALAALRRNIDACRAADRARAIRADVLQPPRGTPQTLVFLDPPYGAGLVGRAVATLRAAGWIAAGTLIIAESSRLEEVQDDGKLAQKVHGAAQMTVWRESDGAG